MVAVGATSGKRAAATFQVQPSLSLSRTSGNVGTSVTATLRGYGATEPVRLLWYDGHIGRPLGTGGTTDAAGSATIAFAVPPATGGPHRIVAVGDTSGALAEATFTVSARLRLTDPAGATDPGGKVGDPLVAVLEGFGAYQAVELRWNADGGTTDAAYTTFATVTTDGAGSASDPFALPDAVRGGRTVRAVVPPSTIAAFTFFTVQPSLTLAPGGGPNGTEVAVALRGYPKAAAIEVRWGWGSPSSFAPVAAATASAVGRADTSFLAPGPDTSPCHDYNVEGWATGAVAGAVFDYACGGGGLAAAGASGDEPAAEAPPAPTEAAPPADTTPPTVALTRPAPGAVLGDTATVAARATDDGGVARVGFQARPAAGGEWGTFGVDREAPYKLRIDLAALEPGAWELRAVAVDAAGNRAASAPVPVTVGEAGDPPGPAELPSPEPAPTAEVTPPQPTAAPEPTPAPDPALSAAVGPEGPLPPTAVAPYRIAGGERSRNSARPALVLDGDAGSGWGTEGPARKASLTLDLGEVRPVAAIAWLPGPTGLGGALEVRLSADGKAWAAVGRGDGGANGWQTLGVAAEARYVRFVFRGAGDGPLGGLAEVTVHGPPEVGHGPGDGPAPSAPDSEPADPLPMDPTESPGVEESKGPHADSVGPGEDPLVGSAANPSSVPDEAGTPNDEGGDRDSQG